MTSEITDTLCSTGPRSQQVLDELAQARLAILGELESSLEASQKALLARDLEGIERETREQVRLQRALAILGAPDAVPVGDRAVGGARPQAEAPQDSASGSAQTRVLHLARVQAALLARAQRSAKMIAHLLAGPEAPYGPSQESGAAGLVAGR